LEDRALININNSAGQLGDVGGDTPGPVAGEQVSRRPSSRLLLEVENSADFVVIVSPGSFAGFR
jgi:hypothetical protein